ncbi:MAG: preprotein translocase subunit SecA, partial [Minisyncoccales bacterium]
MSSFFNFFKKFSSPLKRYKSLVERINSLEPDFEKLKDEDFPQKTLLFKERLKKGEKIENLLPEAFALVREASKRTLGQRHFDVQLLGGIALFEGKIVEMKTGEGKTLTATLPLYLWALCQKGCHLVTVNDYLARRDTVWMGQIFDFLGLSIGCLNHEISFLYDKEYKQKEKDRIRDELGYFRVVEDYLKPCSRAEAYRADITYGTNHEFGFDYLKDNMVFSLKEKVQRNFFYAIVDEVDSILIDEARTPLIISAPLKEKEEIFYFFAKIADVLERDKDYLLDFKKKEVSLKEEGQEKIIRILKTDPWQKGDFYIIHRLENAIKAKEFFLKDKDYIVRGREVVIVDEFTGRLMPGRRWSHGLHQAIEAKEYIRGEKQVKVQQESVTLGTITFQNFFKKYERLAGMTGTAQTSAEEFEKVYNLQVVCIPTNKPMIRKDWPDKIFRTEKEKYEAIVEETEKRYLRGQPVLIGTRSIEKNEYLSKLLQRKNIPHNVLNAKHHEKEGEIIAQAGKLGAVTVATNMAGRGIDIILGGPKPLSEEEVKEWEREREKIFSFGGLFVIGTERHEARRIDNQLRGRAGRQGEPGESQFFISLEDELMKIFGGEKIKKLMETLKVPAGTVIESSLVSKAIQDVQSRIEGLNLDSRTYLLKFDSVFNIQRESFYKKRDEVLKVIEEKKTRSYLIEIFQKKNIDISEYEKKEKEIGAERMREMESFLLLNILDTLWIYHLENIDYLRDVVSLRSFGQLDPLVEFKKESFEEFKKLFQEWEERLVFSLLNLKSNKEEEKRTIDGKTPEEILDSYTSDTESSEGKKKAQLIIEIGHEVEEKLKELQSRSPQSTIADAYRILHNQYSFLEVQARLVKEMDKIVKEEQKKATQKGSQKSGQTKQQGRDLRGERPSKSATESPVTLQEGKTNKFQGKSYQTIEGEQLTFSLKDKEDEDEGALKEEEEDVSLQSSTIDSSPKVEVSKGKSSESPEKSLQKNENM